MEKKLKIKKSSNKIRVALVASGVIINVLLFFMVNYLELPLFLDTFGTIVVAGIAGLFPGIVTAVLTNTLCAFIDSNSLYYMFINVLLSIYSAWYLRANPKRKPGRVWVFVLVTGTVSGIIGAIIQEVLFGVIRNPAEQDIVDMMAGFTGMPVFMAAILANIMVNILDKLVVGVFAFITIDLIPEERKKAIGDSGWKQNPLTEEQLKTIREWGKDVKLSAKTRISVTLVGMSLILVFIIEWIGISLYFENEKGERAATAREAVELAATVINKENIDGYLQYGEDYADYQETKELLGKILETSRGVKYLYVVTIEDKGVRFVFDMDTTPEGYLPGDFMPFDDAFMPYIDLLKKGEESVTVEANDVWGWMLTVYYPLKGTEDHVCYVGADVSMEYVADYMRNFILQVTIIMAGFFVLIVAYALWTTEVYNTYPVASMAEILDRFSMESGTQEQLDENVKKIRALKIKTGDEVEKLYRSICKMTISQADYVKSIRKLSDYTAKMQDGLIITIADLVENRDSDMGSHIQRTTAYVKIIAEGLKKKGYYPEKVSDKFIADVVRSAPLYDVGKIKIPDRILKKAGKLTKEESEIMKTHAAEGKEILENAISTVQGENYLKEARNMAAYHHERWDGMGYPEQIHGEVIPLSARIMAIADEFDALTSNRVYKETKSFDEAVEIIKNGSGTNYDPKCVDAFLEGIEEARVIHRKYN